MAVPPRERAALLAGARRWVIKVGTSVLADADLRFREAVFTDLAREVAALRASGREALIVSSGAIAAGRARLGLRDRPRTLATKQAAAAVGQIDLLRRYRWAFAARGLEIAQVLLTHGDFQSRRRFLNARQTLLTLLTLGVVPLINENDTVAVEEILVGDNDNLSALVATLVDADLLVLLCDVDGLYTADPRRDPAARKVALVEDPQKALAFAQDTANPASTGGMRTKLEAARRAAAYGIPTLITAGAPLDLTRLPPERGTLVLAGARLRSRKHWIAHALKPRGRLVLDAGAVWAVRQAGKSLLPAGVVRVEGNFGPGDPVDLVGPDGVPFARGLVSYGAADLNRIRGCRSDEIEDRLGYVTQEEVVHRDHLALL